MKRIVILGIVVFAIVAIWTGAWFFIAGEAKKQIVALADDGGTGAPTLDCGSLDLRGWPFRFDVFCADATIVSGDQTFTLGQIEASVLVYQLDLVKVFARPPLDVTDAFTGARNRASWTGLDASLRLKDWRISRLSVVGDGLTWSDVLGAEFQVADADHLEFHLVDQPEKLDAAAGTAALLVAGSATGLTVPGLGIAEGTAKLDGEATGVPHQLDGLLAPDALQRWQAAGGNLHIATLRGDDGEKFIDVTGDVKLDAVGRPEGQLTISSRGVVEGFKDTIAPELQGFVLGSQAADGSYSQVLTMTNGVVLSGLMPAGQLLPLW
jgi:hypothetical protein